MKTKTILDAIDALNHARRLLNCGGASIHEQMLIAKDCNAAAASLRVELEREVPDVQIKEKAA